MSWKEVLALLPVAASCFVMIVAQSAATARVYASRHREALDENGDLAGLSAANVAAAVTGTFVVNGSPTQTAMVDRSGGRSQLAHLVVAALVALVLLFLTGPLQYLPRCALGAIVFTIALGLVDLRGLRDIQRESPGEFVLAAGTAAVVVAIGVGRASCSPWRFRCSATCATATGRTARCSWRMRGDLAAHARHSRAHRALPACSSFSSGRTSSTPMPAASRKTSAASSIGAPTAVRWLVVDAGAITSVDYSAARVLRALLDDLSRAGVKVLLVHAEASLLGDLRRHQLTDVAAPGHAFDTLREALAMIRANGGPG